MADREDHELIAHDGREDRVPKARHLKAAHRVVHAQIDGRARFREAQRVIDDGIVGIEHLETKAALLLVIDGSVEELRFGLLQNPIAKSHSALELGAKLSHHLIAVEQHGGAVLDLLEPPDELFAQLRIDLRSRALLFAFHAVE